MKATESGTELLDQAMVLSREAAALRNHLADVVHRHAELLAEYEEKLPEGIDLLSEVRKLFLEAEDLPNQISQLEQRARCAATSFVEYWNSENDRLAGTVYANNRDALREAVQQFQGVLTHVMESMQRNAAEGTASTEPLNARLADVERVLNRGPLLRVVFRLNPLPVIDVAAVARGELLGALDRWIGGLR